MAEYGAAAFRRHSEVLMSMLLNDTQRLGNVQTRFYYYLYTYK